MTMPLSSHARQSPARARPRRRAWRLFALLLAGLLGSTALPANAQSCWINNGLDIAFGEVGTTGRNTSDTLGITCQRSFLQFTAFRVCMFIPAGSPIPGVAPRWMSNYNGAQMSYDLYSDAARTRIIGAYGSGFPTYTTSMVMSSAFVFESTINMPVYARAHPGQSLPATYPFQSQIGGGQLRYSYNVGSLFNPVPSAPTEAQCLSGAGASGSGTVGFHTQVTATFANTCRITTATDLDFGAVTALAGNRDQTSTIQLQCPNGTVWRVGLNNGGNANGNIRRMAGPGGNYLRYELYRDPQRSQRWGNTLGTDTSNGTGTNASQSLTVYGRIPAQASPVPGTYSDTVTVTLTY